MKEKFKGEGNFKVSHLAAIERYLETHLPGCGLKAKPHIESRMKALRAQFYIIHEMLTGSNCNGFHWDTDKKLVYEETLV